MKIYNLDKGDTFTLEEINGNVRMIEFSHLDGMYSVCYIDGDRDQEIHLAGYTPVNNVNRRIDSGHTDG